MTKITSRLSKIVKEKPAVEDKKIATKAVEKKKPTTMNVMIDLETLGTRPGSVILSIGAFEIETERTFYKVIDLKSAMAAGLTVDPGTVEWWMNQSVEARKVFSDPEKVTLQKALLGFSIWLSESPQLCVYGNGSTFDLTLIEAAYRALKLEVPWHYTKVRCHRTLTSLFKGVISGLKREGTAHNAKDDAVFQGRQLKAILEYIESSP